MLRIEVQDTSSVDKEELVRFYVKRRKHEAGRELSEEEIGNCERYIEKVFDSSLASIHVTKSFLGYDSDELVGLE